MQHQKQKLDALLDGINGVAWEMDLNTMQFTYVSSSAERFLGYPAWTWKDLEFWLSLIVPEDRDRAREQCLDATQEGRDHTFDYRVRRSDGKGSFINECELKTKTGKTIPVELHSRTFMLDASRHAFTAVRDISQRKSLEARTRHQEQMLIQQSRLAATGEMIGRSRTSGVSR